eukprot:11772606-Alexandrium_andersonii.AAC.1
MFSYFKPVPSKEFVPQYGPRRRYQCTVNTTIRLTGVPTPRKHVRICVPGAPSHDEDRISTA